MDWKQILAKSPDFYDDEQKEDIFVELLKSLDDGIVNKYSKKLFRLSQNILKFKGEHVISLLSELDSLAAKEVEMEVQGGIDVKSLNDEIAQLQKTIDRLEMDKSEQKLRINELSDALMNTHKKQLDDGQLESDREDSPDVLSEIDRQQELFNNISTKNKHIKRLLRDIEELEKQIGDQSHIITDLKLNLNEATFKLNTLTDQCKELQHLTNEKSNEIIKHTESIKAYKLEIESLEEKRKNTQHEFNNYQREIEERCIAWRKMLDDKNAELDSIKLKYDELLATHSGNRSTVENFDNKQLIQGIQERDNIINELEAKIKYLTEDIAKSTMLMNKLSDDRENVNKTLKDGCCKEVKLMLHKSNKRCRELQKMLSHVEDENVIKSRQALDATELLQCYQSGEEGLPEALFSLTELKQKLGSRDKKIRTLIMELNSAHELAAENSLLKRRLGIKENEHLPINNYMAQQRKCEKLNERLSLKLRASEEMRLQMKLERNDLKREILSLKTELKYPATKESRKRANESGAGDADFALNSNKLLESDKESNSIEQTPDTSIKYCENCLKPFTSNEKLKSCEHCQSNFCQFCQNKINISSTNNVKYDIYRNNVTEVEAKYTGIIEENENLRIGMHEILLKLKEYDSSSNYITIDTLILQKLLQTLEAHNTGENDSFTTRDINNSNMEYKREFLNNKNNTECSEQSIPEIPVPRERKSLNGKDMQRHNTTLNDVECEEQNTTNENSRENLFSQLFTKDKELDELHENNKMRIQDIRKLITENEELKMYKNQYNDFIKPLIENHDERDQLLVRIMEENLHIKIELVRNKKISEFWQEDYETLNKRFKVEKNENLLINSELNKHLIAQKYAFKILQKETQKKLFNSNTSHRDIHEMDQIKKELSILKIKMAYICNGFLKNLESIDINNLNNFNYDEIAKYDIIQDNLTVDILTINEYNNLMNSIKLLENDLNIARDANANLNEQLSINQKQIKLQHDLLTKYSDDEIKLRHSIVDLQSQGNQEFLIGKLQKELNISHEREEKHKKESDDLRESLDMMKNRLESIEIEKEKLKKNFEKDQENNLLKIKYLKKTLLDIKDKFCKFTPLYPIIDFIENYKNLLECNEKLKNNINNEEKNNNDIMYENYLNKVKLSLNINDIQYRIDLAKYQTQCEFLIGSNKNNELKIKTLQNTIDNMKLKDIEESDNLMGLEILFGNLKNKQSIARFDKETQISIESAEKSTITDLNWSEDINNTEKNNEIILNDKIVEKKSNKITESYQTELISTQKSLECQLKQAMGLASTRSALLLEAENNLSEVHGRVKALEKLLFDKEKIIKEEREKYANGKQDDKINTTIAHLQNLLVDKDTTLAKYKELFKNERQEHSKSYDECLNELKQLKNEAKELEIKLNEKDVLIEALQKQHHELVLNNSNILTKLTEKQNEILDNNNIDKDILTLEANENSDLYLDMEDVEKIFENSYFDEKQNYQIEEKNIELKSLENKLKVSAEENKKLQEKLREVSNREKMWERSLNEKDKEIIQITERLSQLDVGDSSSNHRDIEQLRDMLEEKDKHIQDLTDTLTHFHDDQQNFLNDTSLHSAEQVSQLSSDLNRLSATNRILTTQIDAFKRQITNLTQREKQARDLVKSLKFQLIRRPVISLKSDRVLSREDQLQRKIQHVESELTETREELKKQMQLGDNKRVKNAADLALWEKQKKWQQIADKMKIKLNEREVELEKMRSYNITAKNTIQRLEREKHLLESRSKGIVNSRSCQSLSCPQYHGTKYTPAESPESYTTTASDDHCVIGGVSSVITQQKRFEFVMECGNRDSSQEIIDALKSRVENQQRRIVAMELEGKGSHTLTVEMERLHEKISLLEANNLRLEAKNLQLQLDIDMMRQGDDSERNKRQIKHLEDYILVLKNELSQAISESAPQLSKGTNSKQIVNNQTQQQMEQTILALRRVIERLKVENKNLRDTKIFSNNRLRIRSASSEDGILTGAENNDAINEKLKSSVEKLEKLYAEALDKISALQIELDVQVTSCTMCNANKTTDKGIMGLEGGDMANELKIIKDKLQQKAQLLEKAKILLTRAAAKEKNLREQIVFWKRRCSELQNVPVIEEASE